MKEDKGNPNAVTIDETTGVVKAMEAGKAYIECVITLADGTVLRPEAKVTVRNNISEVDISNMPKDQTITVNRSMDFNRVILNTEAGKDKAASGITRWELAENNAGVNEVSDKGILLPTKEGTFKIRAVSFQSKEKYSLWLSDKEANGGYVTAASQWYDVTVGPELSDTELAAEAIRGLFVDAEAPNDEKALAEGVTQAQINLATALVNELSDENTKIFGHTAIAIAQGLFDEKLAEEKEAANVANAIKALEDLFVDVTGSQKELAEGVDQAKIDETTELLNNAMAKAQELLDK